MPPGEEDQEYLIEDVGVRNVEVMLERGNVDISVELFSLSAIIPVEIPSY
jgi:hypothetical protein